MCYNIDDMNINSKYIYKLKFFKRIDSFYEVKGGKSGAKTFCVISDGRKYFVKFRKWKTPRMKSNFNLFDKFVNSPKVYKYGVVDGVQYYIAEYIGDRANQISKLENIKIYEYGKMVATEQLSIADTISIKENRKKKVYKNFYKETLDIYNSARDIFDDIKDTLDIDIRNLYSNIFDEIQHNGKYYLESFKTADVYYCHSDFKTDNFFVVDDNIVTVDYEESDYGYLAFMCRSYPYELMQSATRYTPEWFFTKGIIDTFYKGNIPQDFQKQFVAVYYRAISQYFITHVDKLDKLQKYAKNLSLNEASVNNVLELFNFGEERNIY